MLNRMLVCIRYPLFVFVSPPPNNGGKQAALKSLSRPINSLFGRQMQHVLCMGHRRANDGNGQAVGKCGRVFAVQFGDGRPAVIQDLRLGSNPIQVSAGQGRTEGCRQYLLNQCRPHRASLTLGCPRVPNPEGVSGQGRGAPLFLGKATSFSGGVGCTGLGGAGGELQRFAIAVVACQEADVYMIDEPSSYLDVRQRLKAAQVRSLPSLPLLSPCHFFVRPPPAAA